MTSLGRVRLSDAFLRLSEAEREPLLRLAGGGGSRPVSPEEAAQILSAPDHIAMRWQRASETAQRLLRDLLASSPAGLDIDLIEDDSIGELGLLGLWFPWRVDAPDDPKPDSPDSTELALIPIEVRATLGTPQSLAEADLPVLLFLRDEEDLDELARLHGVSLPESEGKVGAALRISAAMEDPERLQSLYDSLQPGSRRLLFWLCEGDGVVAEAEVGAVAERIAARSGESPNAVQRVLLRLGLLQRLPADAGRDLLVPGDLREQFAEILGRESSERVGEAWARLTASARPAIRDLFPRGAGAAPVHAFRARLLRAMESGVDPLHPVDRLLLSLSIFDPAKDDVGDCAAPLLDAAGPEAFCRGALRLWIGVYHDPDTDAIVEAHGGNPAAIRASLPAPGDVPLDVPVDPEATPEALALQEWMLFQIGLRTRLLFALGLLPGGQWYAVSELAALLTTLYRGEVWVSRRFLDLRPLVPAAALPRSGAELGPGQSDAVVPALTGLLRRVLEPLGALQLDRSGTRFATNPEALTLFRDTDLAFDSAWGDLEQAIGEDIDIWLPEPTEAGIRVNGLASLSWNADDSLSVPADAHLYDLVSISGHAALAWDGAGWEARFTEESVGRGGTDPSECEEFLVWLRIRTGAAIPGRVRRLFPLDASAVDSDDDEACVDAARAWAGEAFEKLEGWAEFPPLPLVEEIRSWDRPAAEVLVARARDLVAASDWANPMLRHACLILGELGDPDALPVLLRVLAYGNTEGVESAASIACARIGSPALESLRALALNEEALYDKRLAATGTLSAMAVLHPDACDRTVAVIQQILDAGELDPDIATALAVQIAETGHPTAAGILNNVRELGLWHDETLPFEEAAWIASVSPSVWGPPHFAGPLAAIYPPWTESERLRDHPDVRAVFEGGPVAGERLFGRPRRARRSRSGGGGGDDPGSSSEPGDD